ncbi:MAG: hypothetical protein NC418_00510 [Muribaculaceae bacterium]|nr:hypothetical protein [Muribaculaceae bacterium]
MTKTFTLLLSAALMGTCLAAEAAPKRAASLTKKKAARIERKAIKAKADAVKVQYLPQDETVSFWDEDTEDWFVASTARNTYNPDGTLANVVETDMEDESGQSKLRISYTYNADGMATETLSESSEDGGATWVNTELTAKKYDTVVTDFAVESIMYYWADGWQLSYGNKYAITRNNEGTLTQIARQAPQTGADFSDIARVTNTTSADGTKVTRSVVSELQYIGSSLEWTEDIDLRNIEWANTDGQVMNFDVEDYARGRNRIASAESYFDGEFEGTLTGVYANDFEGTLTFQFLDNSNLRISTMYTDAATGSYIETYEVIYFEEEPSDEDINGDGEIDDNDVTLTPVTEYEINEVTIDSHGNVVLEKFTQYVNGELDYCGGVVYEYTYNADGAATEFVSSSFEDDVENKFPEMRIEWSDFTTAAGIDGIIADESDAPVEYYNLQGLRVANPADGIFIRRQGSKVSKVRM